MTNHALGKNLPKYSVSIDLSKYVNVINFTSADKKKLYFH